MAQSENLAALIAKKGKGGRFPKPFHETRANDMLQRLAEKNNALAPFLHAPSIRELLRGIFGNSEFLSGIIERDPDLCAAILAKTPERTLAKLQDEMSEAAKASTIHEAMRGLRRAKTEIALLTAIADISEIWTLDAVMRALSTFADRAIQSAVQWLLADAKRKGEIKNDEPEKSGLVVLAMGKLGARELNYSSDVDIVLFYDPRAAALRAAALRKNAKPERFYPDLAKGLARLLQEKTQDGYVFRLDLRLRPDPSATAAAVSLPAALDYYQNLGQHWERAAYIRARPVAGSLKQGRQFLSEIRPFVWRKYLDYAVIEDMHAMKRQVERQPKSKSAASSILGLDIKRGAGGIREIEFFVQTQQLITGGRDPQLRRAGLRDMLGRLTARQWISKRAARDMNAAYRFLRQTEHRLQMIHDAQTHAIPKDEDGLNHLALFLNYPNARGFAADLASHRQKVSDHYAALFARSPSLARNGEALLFTGSDEDPETIQTLASMGFANPKNVVRAAQSWHAARLPATNSPKSRQSLTRLMPKLLENLADTAEPDQAILLFDRFLKQLPAADQLFSLLESQPALLRLLCDICGTAPRLAKQLARYPQMIEALLARADLTTQDAMRNALARQVENANLLEDKIAAIQRFATEQRFRTGAAILRRTCDFREAGKAYADCAETVIAILKKTVMEERQKQRRKENALRAENIAILALGRLGAESMSDASDLDLVFLYQNPKTSQASKDSSAPAAYARWAQAFVSACAAPSAAGKLYDVDMRLRPSGRAGPVALALQQFLHYQRREAETWEHMALVSARTVAAAPNLKKTIDDGIKDILVQPRDPRKIAADIARLRKRIAKAYPPKSQWDIRFQYGGIRDADFLRQYLILIHAHQHPDLIGKNPNQTLQEIARRDLLAEKKIQSLIKAHQLYETLTQILCLCLDGILAPDTAPKSLLALLASAAGMKDFQTLHKTLAQRQKDIHQLFAEIIGEEA